MTIAKLRGIADTVDRDTIIIDVSGVGYSVSVSTHTSQGVIEGQTIALWIETVMKQDQPFLCGFGSDIERQVFRLLISVQGAGAKTALALLSCWGPHMLAQLIQREDVKSLAQAEGVGPKLASRLVLELKKKVLPYMNAGVEVSQPTLSHDDALEGLLQLGYNRVQAVAALQSVMEGGESGDAGHLIRLSLQKLIS